MEYTNPITGSTSPSRSPSPTPSDSSVEIILNTPVSPSLRHTTIRTHSGPTYSYHGLIPLVDAEVERFRTNPKSLRRYIKRRIRLAKRLGLNKLTTKDRNKFVRANAKEAGSLLLKEAHMTQEVKEAKKVVITPDMIQTIDISNVDGEPTDVNLEDTVDQGCGRCEEPGTFIGEIVIQNRFSAMLEAISEHTREGPRRKEPGRHSFHVDASVSCEHNVTGIGVAYKSHRQDWASPWTAKGYRILETLDANTAETWAVWQALECVLEKAHADRQYVKPQDPCSLAVIYSDSHSALKRIGGYEPSNGAVVQKIIAQSIELERLGIKIQLHWVPGHRNIPGNVVADSVSRMARQPVG